MKAIYFINPEDGAMHLQWLGVTPGIGYQVPSGCVDLGGEFPAPPAGFAWALLAGGPDLLEDHRGTVYNTETGGAEQHNVLGALPVGLTIVPRPSAAYSWLDDAWQIDPILVAKLHKDAQGVAWEAIKAIRDFRKEAGFEVGSYWVHSDVFSRSQWLGLKDNARDTLASGGSMSTVLRDDKSNKIVWKMLDGAFVQVTAQLAFDIVSAVMKSDMAIFTAAEQHRAAMCAAADPASYDFTTGWPQSYDEWARAQEAI